MSKTNRIRRDALRSNGGFKVRMLFSCANFNSISCVHSSDSFSLLLLFYRAVAHSSVAAIFGWLCVCQENEYTFLTQQHKYNPSIILSADRNPWKMHRMKLCIVSRRRKKKIGEKMATRNNKMCWTIVFWLVFFPESRNSCSSFRLLHIFSEIIASSIHEMLHISFALRWCAVLCCAVLWNGSKRASSVPYAQHSQRCDLRFYTRCIDFFCTHFCGVLCVCVYLLFFIRVLLFCWFIISQTEQFLVDASVWVQGFIWNGAHFFRN